MAVSKVPASKIVKAIDAVQWAMNSDDAETAAETRKRARQRGPDCVAFLLYVVKTDKFASAAQRVRSACTLLAASEFLLSETRATGLFSEADEADGARGREDG